MLPAISVCGWLLAYISARFVLFVLPFADSRRLFMRLLILRNSGRHRKASLTTGRCRSFYALSWRPLFFWVQKRMRWFSARATDYAQDQGKSPEDNSSRIRPLLTVFFSVGGNCVAWWSGRIMPFWHRIGFHLGTWYQNSRSARDLCLKRGDKKSIWPIQLPAFL